MLYTRMAPLRPSVDFPYVGTQKDIYGLRFSQNTVAVLIMEYISAFALPVTLPFSHVNMYARLYILTTRASLASLPCSKSRILVCAGCSSIQSRITRGLLYCRPAHVYLNILNFKTRAKQRLVKSFNLISLTVVTSPTLKTTLFHPYKQRQGGP